MSARTALSRHFGLLLTLLGCGLIDPIQEHSGRPAQAGSGGKSMLAASGGAQSSSGGRTTGGSNSSGHTGGSVTAGGGGKAQGGNPPLSTGGRASGGASGASAGTAGMAGAGGTGGISCKTHTDCPELSRCRPDLKSCAALRTASSRICPELLGAEHATDPGAIFIGAFAPLAQGSIEARTIRAIYELAVNDFNKTAGGLRGVGDAPPNPLVVVLCDNDNVDPLIVPQGLSHLIDTVGVRTVLAAMDINQLREGVGAYRNAFFVSAVGGSKEFASISNGQAWTMLGLPSDYAELYAALMPHVEAYVRRSLDSRPIRIAAVIEDDNAFQQELSRAVVAAITFNGQGVLENSESQPPAFASYAVTGNGSNINGVAADIHEFQPDVVMSFASDTFTVNVGVMTALDTKYWPDERPFYILSPENQFADKDIHDELARLSAVDSKDHAGRIIGVGAAQPPPESRAAQQDFSSRLRMKLPEARTDFGNYYDAFYFLTYAMYASGPRDALLDGTVRVLDLARGMRRLINLSEPPIAIGDITQIFDNLDVRGRLTQVSGTLGAPDFDSDTGMRRESGSVYCFDSTRFAIQNDVIRYDRANKALVQEARPRCLLNFLSAP